MKKPTMLYASPLPPMRSGISDYSEELLSVLIKEYDVTLLISDYEIDSSYLKNNCRILRYHIDMIDFKQFDHLVYNIGNNPEYHSFIYETCLEHPGMVILHDFVLYYLFVDYHQRRNQLYSKVYLEEGLDSFFKLKDAVKKNSRNLLEQKALASSLPLNKEILKSGNKFMVHSWYSYHKVLDTGLVNEKNIRKINHIALLKDDFQAVSKRKICQKYKIPENAFLVASMGYIDKTKLNHVACKVIKKINQIMDRKVCYVMVGEGSYIDQYVDNNVIFKTGYVELIEFNSFIKYADVILNLRNPSMGETSGAMLRILQQGKVSIINDGGWFSEIPDPCVYKVCLDHVEEDLFQTIMNIMCNPKKSNIIGENATAYFVREYNCRKIVGEIKRFLDDKEGSI